MCSCILKARWQQLPGNYEARHDNHESEVGGENFCGGSDRVLFEHTTNNTQYIGKQHANTIFQYVLFLEFIRAKNCSKFECHETNNHKDRTCSWIHKVQHLFHHGMKRTAKIRVHNHLFSSKYRIILVNISKLKKNSNIFPWKYVKSDRNTKIKHYSY